MIKVIQLTPFYYPVIGGVEGVVKAISEELVKRGHEVIVYTYNINRSGKRNVFKSVEVINGVTVKRVIPMVHVYYGSFAPQLPFKLSSEKSVDIIHVHGYRHPYTEQAWIVARKRGIKTVLHGHSPFYSRDVTPSLVWVWYRMYDRLAKYTVGKNYDIIIALTQHEKNVLIKLGFQPEKIKIIPNPLLNSELIKETLRSIKKWEIDEFKKKYGLHGSPIILYLGRIAKTKRLDRLIRCLPYLSKVEKESLLVLAGPDENYLRELMLLTNRLGVSARVKYIGFLNEKEKSLAFLSSNVYVLPSPYEGYGLTLLEAQAHNIPVVAFKGGGQESATFHGILVQDDNPETLATAIIDAIKLKFNCDPEIFSIKTYVDKIEHIYEQLV